MNNGVKLDTFVPRDYQLPLVKSFEEGKLRRYMAIWPRRCLSGDTHIIMSTGQWKYLKDIQVGDSILSWNGNSFVPDRVKNKWETGIKDTKKVQSYSCLPIVTSNDHVFATIKTTKVYWTALKDIGNYFSLMQYAGLDCGTISDLELMEFLGYMFSDGYCSEYQQPKFTNCNEEILNRVEYLAIKLFNVRVRREPNGNAFNLQFPEGLNYLKDSIKVYFRENGINVPKRERRLPTDFWVLNEESILSFFSGVISGDGSIYVSKRSRVSPRSGKIIPPAVEVIFNCGESDYYAWDCYWLLRKIGILPQVPYKEKGSNWKIKVSKCNDLKKILNNPVYGKNEAREYALSIIKDRYRQAKPYRGFFKLLFKVQDSGPEMLYDIETENHHNFIANGYLVHNSGKDICALNLMIRAALRRVGTYYYVFPTFSMGRRILWDAIDIAGNKIVNHYLPEAIVANRNEQQMRIRLMNGSQIQILGSDDVDKSLVGTNAVGIVFSEYALQDPRAWSLSIPILKASDGWALFCSTVRGKNHFYDLYQVAVDNPDWFCQKLTIEDTLHISIEDIEKEIKTGEISRDLAMQEYWNDWSLGVEGSYYGKYIDDLRRKGQITNVMWEPYLEVHTAWDLGYNDPTVIAFFQIANNQVRIIDYYENNKKGLDHYAKIIKDKPYSYGKHIAPFDIGVHDLSTGITRWQMMHDLGITFVRYSTKAPSIDDGIEMVRRILPRVWMDEQKCKNLIKSLENYRQEYDAKRRVYRGSPSHDDASHGADCFRYLSVSLEKLMHKSSPEDLERRYNEAVHGVTSNLPRIFQ